MSQKVEKVFIPLSWSLDLKENHVSEREVDMFFPFLSIDYLSNMKSQLLKHYELGKDLFHFCCFSLINFRIPQVYHFLEFVHWFTFKYSITRRENWSSDESELLCNFFPDSIKKMINIPKSQGQIVFRLNEEILTATYQQLSPELKDKFMSKIVKQENEFDN